MKSTLLARVSAALLEIFVRERSTAELLLISFLFSLAYTLNLYSVDYLSGMSKYWDNLIGDTATPWIGYLYFIQDAWRFPLFYTEKLGTPEGANIIFTDSIPILALLGKLIYKIFNLKLNLYGPWIGLCYVLQGVFMTLLLRTLGCKNLTVVIGAVLALTMPSFLFRTGQFALPAHFLILAGLTLYMYIYNSQRINHLLITFILLLVVTLLVHPYIFAMNIGIFTAAIGQKLIARELGWRKALTYMAATLGLMFVIMIVAGHVSLGSHYRVPVGSYGRFSLNILSPILPIGSQLFPDLGHYALGEAGFSPDGYNYLGFGIVMLLAIHFLVSPKQVFIACREHRALTLIVILLTLFALTNRIYFSHTLVFSYKLPPLLHSVAETFRSSGRFFWPVSYIFMAGLIVLTMHRFRPVISMAILIAALLLQWVDTAQLRHKISASTRYSGMEGLSQIKAWKRLIQQHQAVKVYPSYQCSTGSLLDSNAIRNINLAAQLVTSQANIPINSSYTARLNKDCNQEKNETSHLQVEKDVLYVILNANGSNIVHDIPRNMRYCRRFIQAYACTQAWDKFRSDDSLLSYFPPLTGDPIPIYTLEKSIDFTGEGDGARYLGAGWDAVSKNGVLSQGSTSTLRMRLDTKPGKDLMLSADTYAFINKFHPEIYADVIVNGKKLARWVFNIKGDNSKRELMIPLLLISKNDLSIEFNVHDPVSQSELGMGPDKRKFGIGLSGMRIYPKQ